MSLTFHIVAKDLARLRSWIAGWAGLLLLPIALGVLQLAANPFAREKWDLPQAINVITGVQVLVGYLLTILLIQEDGIVGTKQFWLTRPIARGRMLAAKTLGAVIIIGLIPVITSLPWWIWCGYGAAQIAQAAIEMILSAMLVIAIPGALVATLTDSFARALLWSVVLVAVTLFAGLFIVILQAATRGDDSMSLVISRLVVAVTAVALEIAMVVTLQFLWRRRGWWLAVAGAVIAASLAGSLMWPIAWLPNQPREHHAERAAGISVRFDGADAEPIPPAPRVRMLPDLRVETRFAAEKVAPEFGAIGMGAQQRWTWLDGRSIERKGDLYAEFPQFPIAAAGLQWMQTDAASEQWRKDHNKVYTPPRRMPSQFSHYEARASAWVWPSVRSRMVSEPPRYEARTWWTLVKPQLLFELPLAPTEWKTNRGRGMRIDDVDRKPGVFTIRMVESESFFVLQALDRLAENHAWFGTKSRWEEFLPVLISHPDREAIGWYEEKARPVIINGVVINWRMLSGWIPQIMRNDKWIPRPGWTGDLSIGVLTLEEAAVFSRDVKVDAFKLPN